MPRYVNLKGSMNTFDNNRPVLSSSERLKNKRDKTIYQAEKQRFQNHKTCGNKNVRYYDNGTIRSMQGYKLQQSLARGNVLCEDCNDRGTLCGSTTRSNFSKIEMSNNLLSEHWGGGGLDISGTIAESSLHLFQTPGFNVIQSDISGVWSGSATDISKSLIGPDGILIDLPPLPSIPMPYGYVNNLIKIPRNLNGNLVVIDGSNVLFPAEMCINLNHLSRKELFPYMKLSNLKTLVKITGAFPIKPIAVIGGVLTKEGRCHDTSYNLLPGSLLTITNYFTPPNAAVLSGSILSLCCIREQIFSTPTGPETYGIFDMYVEIFKISNQQFLSKIINITPLPFTSLPFSGWYWGAAAGGNAFNVNYEVASSGLIGTMGNYNVESVKMIQGLPNLNQTVGNTTKQSYMSCLEDGTKKINFATDNVKKNTIITGYCSGK